MRVQSKEYVGFPLNLTRFLFFYLVSKYSNLAKARKCVRGLLRVYGS
jgi:hypothetical protein